MRAPSASRCSSVSRATRWLRVHLGMYGAWDFAGDILMDATIASSNSRMGQTNQKGTFLEGPNPDAVVLDTAARTRSPRSAHRARTACACRSPSEQDGFDTFPPEPVGQVRVRLLTDTVVADLRGPTACEVLDPAQVEAVVGKLGPIRSSTTATRPRSASRASSGASRHRAAADGPERRRRHRQRLPSRAAVPREAEPAHTRQAGARGASVISGATGRRSCASASRRAR